MICQFIKNIVLLNVSAITLFLLVYEFNTDFISLIFSDLFQAAGFGRFFITNHSLPCNAWSTLEVFCLANGVTLPVNKMIIIWDYLIQLIIKKQN